MKTFEEAWADKEAEGYQYGRDALEQVRFGWELALAARDAELATARAELKKRHDGDPSIPMTPYDYGYEQGRADASRTNRDELAKLRAKLARVDGTVGAGEHAHTPGAEDPRVGGEES